MKATAIVTACAVLAFATQAGAQATGQQTTPGQSGTTAQHPAPPPPPPPANAGTTSGSTMGQGQGAAGQGQGSATSGQHQQMPSSDNTKKQ